MPVIINQHKGNKELEFQTKRVLHLAKAFIKSTKCRGCGEKERSAVGLHEFGDPHLPSQVNIFCPRCKRSEVFALRPSDEAIAYAKMEMKGEQTEVVGKPVDTAEEMVEYAKLWNTQRVALKKEEEKIIKDDNNSFIASPEKVKEIDAKKK